MLLNKLLRQIVIALAQGRLQAFLAAEIERQGT
jgi:hypothetical protein